MKNIENVAGELAEALSYLPSMIAISEALLNAQIQTGKLTDASIKAKLQFIERLKRLQDLHLSLKSLVPLEIMAKLDWIKSQLADYPELQGGTLYLMRSSSFDLSKFCVESSQINWH